MSVVLESVAVTAWFGKRFKNHCPMPRVVGRNFAGVENNHKYRL
jgi:hypothetical protein